MPETLPSLILILSSWAIIPYHVGVDHFEWGSNSDVSAFADVQASYASNEVCLNWNAPAVFVLGYLEQVVR